MSSLILCKMCISKWSRRLEESAGKYKKQTKMKMIYLNFEVGDLLLAHLCKERFIKGKYKLKWKKIGPCNILRKFSINSYEIELPDGVGIYPIFNVTCLYPFVVG